MACACLLAFLLVPIGSLTHELHFDFDEAHGGQACAMGVASAQHADHNKAGSSLLVDPTILVEITQQLVAAQPPGYTLPLNLTARSPPTA